jgi:hypothetical protein
VPRAKIPEDRLMCAIYNINPDSKTALKQLKRAKKLAETQGKPSVQCPSCGREVKLWMAVRQCDSCLGGMVTSMKITRKSHPGLTVPLVDRQY